MEFEQVKNLILSTFDSIRQSTSIAQIEQIVRTEIPPKYHMKKELYPPIAFSISTEDIKTLKANHVLTSSNRFSPDISSLPLDPLTKLLYAIVWKRGDLQKVNHIIEGIEEVDITSEKKEEGLVFYHFGKYLTKLPNNPIIDQHVLRAFKLYQLMTNKDRVITPDEVNAVRKVSVTKMEAWELINDYKVWLQSDDLKQELKQEKNYCYSIDQLLYAVGKSVKQLKKSSIKGV